LRIVSLAAGLFLLFQIGLARAEPLEIAAWGDSLTQGRGASSAATTYPAQACAMIKAMGSDCRVHNMGWGGQNSTQIAARQGAVAISVQPLGPDGPDGLALAAPSVDVLEIAGRPAGKLAGSLAGVAGLLQTDPAGQWRFAPAGPDGAALARMAGRQPFVPSEGIALRQAETWIWAGRNNLRAGDTVLRDIAAMIAFLGHDRYLVAEVLPSARDTPAQHRHLDRLNRSLAETHGAHFVPLIVALQAAGDGSAQDDQDVAAGLVPSSLRSDAVHLNDQGYRIVAAQFVAAWRRRP